MDPNDPDYWVKTRQVKWSSVPPPPEWPKGVRPISLNGTGLFGIDERRGTIHWDGAELETKNKLSLRWFELALATLATAAVVAGTVVQVLSYAAGG